MPSTTPCCCCCCRCPASMSCFLFAGLVGSAIAALMPQLELSAGYTDTVSKGYTSGYAISLQTGTHGRALSCILLQFLHCVSEY